MSLAFTKHHTMKTYGVMKVQIQSFLTLATAGGEGSASHPSGFTSWERDPGTP
jgi:hypothetical protein